MFSGRPVKQFHLKLRVASVSSISSPFGGAIATKILNRLARCLGRPRRASQWGFRSFAVLALSETRQLLNFYLLRQPQPDAGKTATGIRRTLEPE